MSSPVFRVNAATAATITATLPTIHYKHRPRGADVQSVLRTLAASWKHRPGHAGPHADLSVEQLAEQTMIGRGTVRDCLAVLRAARLVYVAVHGGGRGAVGRGTVYHLALGADRCPVCTTETARETARDYPAENDPKLRGTDTETARDSDETARDQSRASVFSSVLPICSGPPNCQCDACHPPGHLCDECTAGRARIAQQIELPWFGDLAWWTPRTRHRPPPPAELGEAAG